jgi:hypothetical protein
VCLRAVAGRIACKDASLYEACAGLWTPSATFDKLLAIEHAGLSEAFQNRSQARTGLLCRRVAHPWHAIQVTEATRRSFIQGVRGLRPQAEHPHGTAAERAAAQRNLQGDRYAPSI